MPVRLVGAGDSVKAYHSGLPLFNWT